MGKAEFHFLNGKISCRRHQLRFAIKGENVNCLKPLYLRNIYIWAKKKKNLFLNFLTFYDMTFLYDLLMGDMHRTSISLR